MVETQTTTEQPPEAPGSVLPQGFNTQLLLLTWVAFAVAAVVLAKVLWRPILRFLESRESEIRSSLEDAEKARKAAADADVKAATVLADAEREARVQADARAAEARKHIAEMELAAHEAMVAKRKAAEEALEAERTATLKQCTEQAGAEIAHALETLLPGMLTDDQKQAYQNHIASNVKFR